MSIINTNKVIINFTTNLSFLKEKINGKNVIF